MSKFQFSIIGYLSTLIALSILFYPMGMVTFSSVFIGLTFLYSLFLFVMSMWIQQNFFLNSIHQNHTQKVVLSFDDGPHPKYTLDVLEILDRYNIKALFFVIGNNVTAHPEITNEIIKRGHQIGVHTQSHSNFFGLFGQKKVHSEIELCSNSIQKATGKVTQLFRPPFGVTNPIIAKEVQLQNFQSIGWNVRSFDTTTKNVDTLIKRVTSQVSAKSIVLLHDRLPQTVDSLPEIIKKIKGMGFDIGALQLKVND